MALNGRLVSLDVQGLSNEEYAGLALSANAWLAFRREDIFIVKKKWFANYTNEI